MGLADTTIQSCPSIRFAVNSVVVISITQIQQPYSVDQVSEPETVSNVALPPNSQLIFKLIEIVVIGFDNLFPPLYSLEVILDKYERKRLRGE